MFTRVAVVAPQSRPTSQSPRRPSCTSGGTARRRSAPRSLPLRHSLCSRLLHQTQEPACGPRHSLSKAAELLRVLVKPTTGAHRASLRRDHTSGHLPPRGEKKPVLVVEMDLLAAAYKHSLVPFGSPPHPRAFTCVNSGCSANTTTGTERAAPVGASREPESPAGLP